MEEIINKLAVEKVMNGFEVYLQDYRHNGTARPTPYVFETMENLLKFIEQQLNKKYGVI
jgi:hypothetical protein